MASASKDNAASRPSWSKIAASGYVPPGAKMASPKSPPASANTLKTIAQPQIASRETVSDQKSQEQRPLDDLRVSVGETSTENKPTSKVIATKAMEPSTKSASNDDGSTQTSSDDSAKPFSFDTKSVTSAATFALDEKESLRPDDSASMRAAIEEEDMFSAPGSVIAGSRVGSDFGAKPFREQLQEIPYIVASQARVVPGALSLGVSNSASPAPNQVPNGSKLPGVVATQDGVSSEAEAPDEKLMDALQSQRDRVWVLKLEQDIIDFVGQSKEASLTLPQCNAFYRMLAHKLADYYKLDHTVAQTGTGAAVVISRTSFARIPPPLSGIAIASNVADTPPLIATARKIMRRAGDPRSETTTAANSEGPSASVSEVGIDLSAADASAILKAKALLTREEREKQYAEARERIFGKSSADDVNEDNGNLEDVDQSRSSSAAGKKKSNIIRRQRNLSDDDFEPRSQYPAYYNNSGFAADGAMPHGQLYYAQQTGSHAGQSYAPQQSADTATDPTAAYGFNAQGPPTNWHGQFYPSTSPNAFSAGSTHVYNMSAHMQSAMQLQGNPASGGNSGNFDAMPYPHPYASSAMPTSPQPMMPAWQHPSMQFNQGYNVHPYAGFPGHQMSSHFGFSGMGHRPQMSDFGQMQPQQFNPQTQAFVPTMPASPYQQMPAMLNQYQQYGPMAQSPPQSYAFGPGFSAASPQMSPQPQNASASFHSSPVPNSHNGRNSHAQEQKTRNKQRPNIGAAGHVNTSVGGAGEAGMEITAKFGMPSHLPARPPPAPPQQQQLTDQHIGASAMPRMSAPTGTGAGTSIGRGSKNDASSPARNGSAGQ